MTESLPNVGDNMSLDVSGYWSVLCEVLVWSWFVFFGKMCI